MVKRLRKMVGALSQRIRLDLKTTFMKHVGIVFFASNLSNVFNLLFTIYVINRLEPEEYGLFNSLLSLFMIASQPLGIFSVGVTRFVSIFHSLEQHGKIRYFLKNLSRQVFFISVVFMLILLVFSPTIANYLHNSSVHLVALILLAVFISYLSAVPSAALQGFQQFLLISYNILATGAGKLLLVMILMHLGFRIMAPLQAFIFSGFISLLLSVVFLFAVLRRIAGKHKLKAADEDVSVSFADVYIYLIPVCLFTFGFQLLNNIDVILVRHFFSELDTGFYSIAQMYGKIVFYFVSPIAFVMFPKIIGAHARKEDTFLVLQKCLLVVVIACLGVITLSYIAPELILKFLTGRVYKQCIPLIRIFAINMGLLAVINIFVQYFLAVNRIWYSLFIFLAVILEAVLIYCFHGSLLQVLQIISICFSLLFITSFILLRKTQAVKQAIATA